MYSRGRPQTGDREHRETDTRERPQTSSDVLVDILREQLMIMREELQEARHSAQAAREREALLLQMLQDMQHRYDRLLDMPRRTPACRSEGACGIAPAGPGTAPRGAMRRRIVALLREHPEGLTPTEMRTRLGVNRSLADTCPGMLRDGLVQRVGRGRYVATTPSRP